MESTLKKFKYSLNVNILFAAIVVLLIAALFFINGIAVLLSDRYGLDADLTAAAVFDIGEDTRQFLQVLDRHVEIFVLSDEEGFSGSRYLDQARRILERYPRSSRFVTLEFIDYLINPAFAIEFPQFPLSHGDIIVRSGENVSHVPVISLFHYTQTPGGGLAIISSRAEEAITSAIASVITDEIITVALLAGNATADGSHLATLLENNNYDVQVVNIATADLRDFDVAVLLAPSIDLSADAVRRISEFLYNDGMYGKVLLYTASAGQGYLPNLDLFLSQWGISFSNGAVFETRPERTFQMQPYYPIARYETHRLTDMLRDNSMPFLMPLARPMETLFTSRDGYFIETLTTFSETSGVRPADAGADFTPAQAERTGPMPALVMSSFNVPIGYGELKQSHVIVSSSTAIFDPIALHNTSVTNAEYILNLLGDLTDREFQFNIMPTSLAGRTLGLTSAEASRLGVIFVGMLPAAILLTGIGIWVFRRYR